MCYWGEIFFVTAPVQSDSVAAAEAVKHLPLMCPQIHSDTVLVSAMEFTVVEWRRNQLGAVFDSGLCYHMKRGLHSTYWDGACCLGIVEGYFFSRLCCLQKPSEIKVGI